MENRNNNPIAEEIIHNNPTGYGLFAGIGDNFNSAAQAICELADDAISNLRANSDDPDLSMTIVVSFENLGDAVEIGVVDGGTGITNLDSALTIACRDGAQTPLNEHGFGLKHALASCDSSPSQQWSIRTRTKKDAAANQYGFDKYSEDNSDRTIILAKANMLIYLSKLITENPDNKHTKEIAKLFNDTFTLKKTNLGTLESLEENKYNLILTNPPYVVNGSGDMKALATATGLYKCGGLGLEALFMEWIVKSLAEDGTALIVIPDGILSNLANKKLREYILDRCTIEGIISLPINTFFGTPKKTYILAIKKKYTDDLGNTQKQVAPVFTYICNSIGETLDVYRFDTEENHLEEAVNQYNLFKSTPDRSKFKAISYDEEGKPYIDKKCKLIDIQKFYDAVDTSWIIDNFWSDEEKIELGFKKEVNIMTIPELQTFIDNVIEAMEEYRGDLECLI